MVCLATNRAFDLDEVHSLQPLLSVSFCSLTLFLGRSLALSLALFGALSLADSLALITCFSAATATHLPCQLCLQVFPPDA